MKNKIMMNSIVYKIIHDFKEVKSFLIIGIFNTITSALGMLFLYNILNIGYWLSSATMYVSTSVLSFILNRKFTFHGRGSILFEAIKFFCNIGVCYLFAYGISPILVNKVMIDRTQSIKDQVAMLVAMVLFTGLNYFGQKLFVFYKKE